MRFVKRWLAHLREPTGIQTQRSFFEWTVGINALPDSNGNTELRFWIEQVSRAHD